MGNGIFKIQLKKAGYVSRDPISGPSGIFIKNGGFLREITRRCRRSGSKSSSVVPLAFGCQAGLLHDQGGVEMLPLIFFGRSNARNPGRGSGNCRKNDSWTRRWENIKDELS